MANYSTKLDEALIEEICHAIRSGNYIRTACSLVGVAQCTFYAWMKHAREPGCKPIFKLLEQSVRQAEADVECKVVKSWVDQTPKEWQAARDFLARRFPDRWAPKEKREISGPNGAPLQMVGINANINLDKLTDEELEALAKITRKLTPSDDGPDLADPGEEVIE